MPDRKKPFIVGLEGERLTPEEERFFREHKPAGFILFQRNCVNPAQVKALTATLKEISGSEKTLILIDQEGGRVARLKPPHWRLPPPAGDFAAIAARDPKRAERLVYLNARLIAAELRGLGVTSDCAPLADVPAPECHAIIGDRAFGDAPEQVALLAGAMAKGLSDGGVLPVLKHLPGHGRATADSHEELPEVAASLAELQARDFVPFRRLAHLPLGMTAHIRYAALDAERPSTLSPRVLDIIRKDIGFSGILMTDDLSMKALKGDMGELAAASLAAGCDLVLHCNGKMEEMRRIAEALTLMPDAARRRMAKLWKTLPSAQGLGVQSLAQEYDILAAQAGLAA